MSNRNDPGEHLNEDLPIDVMPASNGEFVPLAPTDEQRMIMQLADEETEKARRRFGMSRRDFVRSAAAYGIGLWAINQIMPTVFGSYKVGAHNTETTAACDLEWPGAQLDNLPGEFIFDVQSHHVESGRHVAGQQPRLPRLLHGAVGAGRARWAAARPCEPDGRPAASARRRARPDREPVALPLPQGAVPRLLRPT